MGVELKYSLFKTRYHTQIVHSFTQSIVLYFNELKKKEYSTETMDDLKIFTEEFNNARSVFTELYKVPLTICELVQETK